MMKCRLVTDLSHLMWDKRLPKVLLPMIRRVFPTIIASEIVGVNPMSGPVGKEITLRYKYTTYK